MRNLTGKFSRKPSTTSGLGFNNSNEDSPAKKSFETDNIREDLFARPEIYPENSLLSRPSIRRIVWLILALLMVALSSWFCFLGPGAPVIRSYLESSADRTLPATVATYTPTNAGDEKSTQAGLSGVTSQLDAETNKTPTLTRSPTLTKKPTELPTHTPTHTVEPSPTPVPVLNTPTPTSEVAGCVPASEVKITDVGSTLCVSGRVVRTIDKPAGFLIILVEEPEAFYFVAYDLKYPNLEDPKNKNQCVYAIGEIRQLGNNPIMVVSYSVPLQYCSP